MNKKILIVDDTPADIDLAKGYLSVWGYEILTVSNGQDALKIANEQKIDLVLLDAVMPDIDGFEVCKKLKTEERTKFIPVLMITSLNKDYRLLAINLGADEFLSKPVDKIELTVRVNSLLRIKSLHDELEENYKTLKDLSKLKDDLSGTITHDINNLLTIMKNFLDYASCNQDVLPLPVKERLVIATRASDDLGSLISDFIDIKKMEESKLALHLEPVNVSEVIGGIIENLKLVALDKGIELQKQVIGSISDFSLDKRLICRVIINLIMNAIKSTPSGGKIEIIIQLEGAQLKFSVKDTGIGVPQEFKEKIFEKFFSLEDIETNSRRGKGLGLTFCKLAVEAHGGRIWVESEGKNKGSTFIFTLPRK